VRRVTLDCVGGRDEVLDAGATSRKDPAPFLLYTKRIGKPACGGRGRAESLVKILLGHWVKPTCRAVFALPAAAWMVSAGSVISAPAQDGPGLGAGLNADPDRFVFGGLSFRWAPLCIGAAV